MGYWIITIVLFLITAGLIVWRVFSPYYDIEISLPAFGVALIALSFLATCLLVPIVSQREIYTFKEQTAYFETHSSDNNFEDLSLTQNKLKLNEWLYNAQFRKQYYPAWSFMPDEVMDLKPIK